MPFKKVNPKQSFPALEKEILEFWEREKIFEKSVRERDAQKTLHFFDGPPFATGLPHYGHILQGVIKDLIPRFFTMQGYRVPRQWGWDCHGLPVENLIEKELKLTEPGAVPQFGIGKFNEACRASVLKFAREWEKTVKRMGRFIDFQHSYKTMDREFMAKVWQVFGALWQKGLVYEGLKPMHICPRCATPLSNFEVGLNYRETTDLSCIVKFRLVAEAKETYCLAWTTTPWTLPGNTALTVNPKLEYARVRRGTESLILAAERVAEIFAGQEFEIVEKFPGQKLVGKKYEPPFAYFSAAKEAAQAFQILPAHFVKVEEGTGIVHIAPAFGEDDYQLAQEFKLPIWQTVDLTGQFRSCVSAFAGVEVKPRKNPRATDEQICNLLESQGKLFCQQNFKHSYPFCWRCETPLLNYATKSWFVAVEKIKPQLLKNNQLINWQPPHIREGRFGKWLENARDWAVSRNRFWGTPIPVWRCVSCGQHKCLSSGSELAKLSGQAVPDLHKHFIDQLEFPCAQCGQKMRRTPEVFDCWFESGAMPFAVQKEQNSQDKPLTALPADFIAEAQDQTRGWFYTLHVLATALLDKPIFKNCICSGLVLAEDGEKMSKSKQNFPDPAEIFAKYGADAMRFYLMNSPVTQANDLRFAERGVAETLRAILLPFWNTFYFFTTYARADGFEPPADEFRADFEPHNALDRWILSELNILTREMTQRLSNFEIQKAISPLAQFLEGLTNWYVRRSRRRFWKAQSDQDKRAAYQTLFRVLTQTAKLLAPVCPFLAEKVWRDLTGGESVHLAAWPKFVPAEIETQLSQRVATLRKIISLGLSIRAQQKIKVRQPLSRVTLTTEVALTESELATIREELNVKELSIVPEPTEIATRLVRVNARQVGQRLGAKVQKVIAAAKQGAVEFLDGEAVRIEGEVLRGDEITLTWQGRAGAAIASERGLVVALDLEITPALAAEGRARDLNRKIQELRRARGLEVSDRIELQLAGADEILANEELREWLQQETLAKRIVTEVQSQNTVTFEGIKIGLKKISEV